VPSHVRVFQFHCVAFCASFPPFSGVDLEAGGDLYIFGYTASLKRIP